MPSIETNTLRHLRRTTLTGITVSLILVGGFTGWAAQAQLAASALATGFVGPEGSRRVVQHLEGGIIRALSVKDGDRVRKGQTLMVLDATRDQAGYNLLELQHLTAQVTLARLAAETTPDSVLTLPSDLAQADDLAVLAVIAAQRQTLVTRRAALAGSLAVIAARGRTLDAELQGVSARITASQTQLALIDDEITVVAELVEKQLERKARLYQLQRAHAQASGDIAASQSDLLAVERTQDELAAERLAEQARFDDRIATERAQVQADLALLAERLLAQRDVLGRTTIVAPVDGTVTASRFHTVGGVVPPGAAVLDLVPSSDRRIIDVAILPADIDSVQVGQTALVRFPAYAQRDLPRIEGQVIYVAADSVLDDRSGRTHFPARVEVDAEVLARLAPRILLSPGMPADVAIHTGERTALRYALDPLIRSMERSFVEE
jgi:HlyD family secretion protein